MTPSNRFVFLIDSDMLAQLQPGWPKDMALALILDNAGTCQLACYHRDEADLILPRLSAQFKDAQRGFSVAPKVPGYVEKTLYFSEEQKLLALVGAADDLVETATDYAINYRFACEEGLDPQHMLRRPVQAAPLHKVARNLGGKAASKRARKGPGKVVSKGVNKVARAAPEVKAKPRRRSNLTLGGHALDVMPAGMLEKSAPPAATTTAATTVATTTVAAALKVEGPARQTPYQSAHTSTRLPARLEICGNWIRLTINPGASAQGLRPRRVGQIVHRPDFAQFALARSSLGGFGGDLGDDLGGAAAVLDIPIEKFPKPLVARYLYRPHQAEVLVGDDGIFVTCGAALAAKIPPLAGAQRRALLPQKQIRGVPSFLRGGAQELSAVERASSGRRLVQLAKNLGGRLNSRLATLPAQVVSEGGSGG